MKLKIKEFDHLLHYNGSVSHNFFAQLIFVSNSFLTRQNGQDYFNMRISILLTLLFQDKVLWNSNKKGG